MKGHSMVDGNSHLFDIDGSGELHCPPSLVVVFELLSRGAGFEVTVDGKCSITAGKCGRLFSRSQQGYILRFYFCFCKKRRICLDYSKVVMYVVVLFCRKEQTSGGKLPTAWTAENVLYTVGK